MRFVKGSHQIADLDYSVDGRGLDRRVRELLEMREKAIGAYRRSLELDPSQVEVEKLLQSLTGAGID